MDQGLQELGEFIQLSMPEAVTEVIQEHEELILICALEKCVSLLTFLRDDSNCLFKILSDMHTYSPFYNIKILSIISFQEAKARLHSA